MCCRPVALKSQPVVADTSCSMPRAKSERRKHLRYNIGPDDPVTCRLQRCHSEDQWRPVQIADESYSGCSVILEESGEVDPGESLHLNFGSDYQTEAVVLRVDRLSPSSLRLGCRFIQ